MSVLRKTGLVGAILSLGAAAPALAHEPGAPCPTPQASTVAPDYSYASRGYVAPQTYVAPQAYVAPEAYVTPRAYIAPRPYVAPAYVAPRFVHLPHGRFFIPRPHFRGPHVWFGWR